MSEINFPPELPISENRHLIAEAIKNNQVVIVAGETGSGKTTQLPKIALALGRKSIAHTQPRRIAARAVAERIAEELETDLGQTVGYQVRFTDKVSDETQIRLMTDGILLAQVHRDRKLLRYDTIIIDEAHERSLNIDFLLGYLKRLLPKRPDLKVIITSATIDPVSFAEHFKDKSGKPAPIIEVSGRTYPVEIRYQPLGDQDLFEGIKTAVTEVLREGPGNILVFLSGESEIRDAVDVLKGMPKSDRLEVLPLYGRLSAAAQHRVFSSTPAGKQRVILATNVAETSLTVPGITYVIDTGFARISRWSARSKVQRLPIEAISKASAGQRAGRAGRLRPGVAVRLYDEEDFESRPDFTEPEILRTGLASVILQMLSLNLGEIMKFPFLTPPDKRGVAAGMQLLTELGAVHESKITRTGRDLAKLPIEPRFARMIIESFKHEATKPVIAIVAGLTVQDVRERPEEERAKADSLHARFKDPFGDLMTLLNLWNYLEKKQLELSSGAFRKLCRAEFLNYMRVREWFDLVRQLTSASTSIKAFDRETNASAEAVLRSVLAGLLSHLGLRDDTKKTKKQAQEYLGSRGTRFVLHPGSVLAKKPPEMVMSVELVETSRLFARANSVVDPAWAESIAKHLIKRQVSDPHWQKSRGAATAYERLTLFGIPIVERRPINYARVNTEHARELFIRHALVDGEWTSSQSFDRANWQLRREIEALEARGRRRDLLASDDAIYEFYDERVPAEVASQSDFEGWWKKAANKTPKLLHLKREDLLEATNSELDAADSDFPRVWSFGEQKLKLKYRFEPGAKDDGVSVVVPLPLLPSLKPADVARLVPGLRLDLVEALIRSLPKGIRRNIVPARDWAQKLLRRIDVNASADILQDLAREIRQVTSQPVTTADFDLTKLPPHLTPNYAIVDDRGRTLGASKELSELQEKFKQQASKQVANVAVNTAKRQEFEKPGLNDWQFGDLAKVLDTHYDNRGGAGTVRAYPALVDRKTHVDLKLTATTSEQHKLHRRGTVRMLLLGAPDTSEYIRDHLTNEEKLLIAQGPFQSLGECINEVLTAMAFDLLFKFAPGGLVWRQQDFTELKDAYAKASIQEVYDVIAKVVSILREARTAGSAIEKATSLNTLTAVSDAKKQLQNLIGKGFIVQTGLTRLERMPIYLKAIKHRMTELQNRAGKDRVWQNEIEEILAVYEAAGGSIPLPIDAPDNLVQVRWLLEEMRVSLFAQHLGTSESVSKKRILKLLQ